LFLAIFAVKGAVFLVRAGTIRRHGRRGSALLEVVLALTLFVGIAYAILAGLAVSVRSATELRQEAQAADLAVTILSEIEMGITPAADAGPTPFDKPFDAWTWQTVFTPGPATGIEGADLSQLQILVSNAGKAYTYRLCESMPASGPATAAAAPMVASGGDTSGAETASGSGSDTPVAVRGAGSGSNRGSVAADAGVRAPGQAAVPMSGGGGTGGRGGFGGAGSSNGGYSRGGFGRGGGGSTMPPDPGGLPEFWPPDFSPPPDETPAETDTGDQP
jgi:hypothetical protein